MYKVSMVKESRHAGYIILSLIRDGARKNVTVTKKLYQELGSPEKNELIDEGAYELLKDEDECYRALSRALSILSYADNSKRTLLIKLRRAGFSREAVDYAVDNCLSYGYINEKGQLERLILSLANGKLKGPKYIRSNLLGKGYSLSDIDGVMRKLVADGEIDFKQNLSALADKKGVEGTEGLHALAYKNGF